MIFDRKFLIRIMGVFLLALAHSAMGMQVYENGTVQFKESLEIEGALADTYSFTFYIKDAATGTVLESKNFERDGTLDYRVTLEPGVYKTFYSGNYYKAWSSQVGGGTTSIFYRSEDVNFTVLEQRRAPYAVLQTPFALDCTSDFSIEWDEVDVSPAFADRVSYKIEERSAPIGEALPDSWTLVALNYEGNVENGFDNTLLRLPPGKASKKQYQYRVSSSYVLGGYRSTYSTPKESAVFIKPGCSETEDYHAFIEVTGSSEKLATAPPNVAGISFNNIEQLSVSKTLDILNFSSDTHSPAKLIVIKTSSADISGHVRILGQTADLLIINTNESSSSLFKCVSCSFENVDRLTLAQANESNALNPEIDHLGKIITNNQTKMVVNGLTAPGVLSLELFSGQLSLRGIITTNMKGKLNSLTREYELSYDGNLSIASGAVSAFVGGFSVEYEDLEIKAVRPKNINDRSDLYTSTIEGNIEALSINMTTTENLNIKSVLVTDADIIASNTYRDKLFVPDEGIRIQSMGKEAVLNIDSALMALSNIDLRSFNQLNIRNDLDAKKLTLISIGGVHIEDGVAVRADNLEIGAGSIENNGNLFGNEVYLNADTSILNRFGGNIRGRDIAIVSKNGTVRNGSLTPYRATSKTEYSNTSTGELYQLGSYYQTEGKGTSGIKQRDLSAHIFGNRVKVGAKNIENVNPFYMVKSEGDDWSDGVLYPPQMVRQVGIYGVQELTLASEGRLLNSSAELFALDPDSKFAISAGRIINERYRTDLIPDLNQNVLEMNSAERDVTKGNIYLTATSTDYSMNIEHLVSSPPASIYAAGTAEFRLAGDLNNAHSFIEFVGPTRFEKRGSDSYQPKIRIKGVDLNKFDAWEFYDPCADVISNQWQQTPRCVVSDADESGNHFSSVIKVGTDATYFISHDSLIAVGVGLATENIDAFKNFISLATETSIDDLDQMTEWEYEEYIRSFLDKIKEFLEEVRGMVANAWDSLINWFS